MRDEHYHQQKLICFSETSKMLQSIQNKEKDFRYYEKKKFTHFSLFPANNKKKVTYDQSF